MLCFMNLSSSLPKVLTKFTVFRKQYETLEACVIASARSCVPVSELDSLKIEEIVIETLRNTLQTKKVN